MKRLAQLLFMSIMLLGLVLNLSGCGGSSGDKSSSVGDPFAAGGGAGTSAGTSTTAITAQDPTFNLVLTTDLIKPTDLTKLPQIDANIGTVLLTAQCLSIQGGVLIDPNTPSGDIKIDPGAPVQNQKIEYKIIAGPGTITYPAYSGSTPGKDIVTDSNGKVEAVYTSGNVLYTTNVIIEASTTIGVKTYRAYTQFQIVRGTGVITFVTTKTPTDPDGTLHTLDKTVAARFAGIQFTYMQQAPFKVTDSNGNPRVGVPITFSIESQLTNLATVTIQNPTVTTDSAGSGIFNIGVIMTAPAPGVTVTDSVIYKAVSNDANPLVAYGGFVSSLTTQVALLAIAPTSSSFAAADAVGATRTFLVSGGSSPYAVNSDNSAKVRTTISGSVVTATLVDAALWTDTVTISVVDSSGQTASATIKRQ